MARPASLVASVVLLLIAVGHLLRIVLQVHISAEGIPVPMWPSVVAVVVFGLLSLWLFRERVS
ncbi:hypothetical protein HUU42_06590 [bacterium]|nr:hypothetical protein [bacterium]